MKLVAMEMTEKGHTFLQCCVPNLLESDFYLAETKVQPTEWTNMELLMKIMKCNIFVSVTMETPLFSINEWSSNLASKAPGYHLAHYAISKCICFIKTSL